MKVPFDISLMFLLQLRIFSGVYPECTPKLPSSLMIPGFCWPKTASFGALIRIGKNRTIRCNDPLQGGPLPVITCRLWIEICFIYTPIPGKMIQFDLRIFFKWVAQQFL